MQLCTKLEVMNDVIEKQGTAVLNVMNVCIKFNERNVIRINLRVNEM